MSGGVLMALRTALSLIVVLAIVFAASRLLGRSSGHGGRGVLDVLARQPLGRTASVAVVRVADRAYVLGVTEDNITLLDDTDLAAMTEIIAAARPAPRRPRLADQKAAVSADPGSSPLQGSILSPAAWRQGIEAVRERTARR